MSHNHCRATQKSAGSLAERPCGKTAQPETPLLWSPENVLFIVLSGQSRMEMIEDGTRERSVFLEVGTDRLHQNHMRGLLVSDS